MLTTSRGFWITLLLSIVTFGIYPLYLIHAFSKETNLVCSSDGKHTGGLLAYILLGIITLGIYGIVWQYKIIERRANFLVNRGKDNNLTGGLYIASIFLGGFTLGILNLVVYVRFIHQQNRINALYNQENR